MKESDREDLASSSGLKPYAGDGNIVGVAWVRGDAGQPLSSEINPVCRPCTDKGKATSRSPHGKESVDTAESETLSMCRNSKRENREILLVSTEKADKSCHEAERSVNVTDGTPDTNVNRKSDDSILPAKWANKVGTPAAESAEERESPKGKALTGKSVSGTEPVYAEFYNESYGSVGMMKIIPTVIPEGGAV